MFRAPAIKVLNYARIVMEKNMQKSMENANIMAAMTVPLHSTTLDITFARNVMLHIVIHAPSSSKG